MNILITGGAGFIGSAVIRVLLSKEDVNILNVDSMTYAGNLESLPGTEIDQRYSHKLVDICDADSLSQLFYDFKPDKIMHLAAESHVDRSIDGPADFIKTNVIGTFNLLEAARRQYESLDAEGKSTFRFHHVSTDEVYGDLEGTGDYFTENTPYAPSSPYSASKASSDHLVRAWARTYGLPVVVSNCSNNYGPYQFPEKLIPHMILSALHAKPLTVYGDGLQVRDWLYVEDHAEALLQVLEAGVVGETYNIGGNNEKSNIEVVEAICDLLEELAPDFKPSGVTYFRDLISFVTDRPGHDVRYAIDASKIKRDLGWGPVEDFESGLRKTVMWYLENKCWWGRVLSGAYRLERLGGSHD